MGSSQDKVILVDGNSLLHRAFYAIPTLTTSQGEYTNAVLGFTNMLVRLLEDEQPDYVAVAFDLSEPTFRHEQFEDYKSHRPHMPDELVPQVSLVKETVRGFSIPILELEGYEADDIIGTLACHHAALGRHVLIVTGDRDCLQLVDDQVTALITRRGISDLETYDPEHVQARHGVPPHLVADLKGLMGDSSDNIPGVPGIGPKTGVKLLREFGSLEGVLANIDELRGKQRENLKRYADQARLSRQLATIDCDVPISCDLNPYARDRWDEDKLCQLFSRLEFRNLLSRLSIGEVQLVVTKGEKEVEEAAGVPEFELFCCRAQIEAFVKELKKAERKVIYLDPFIDNPDSIDATLVGLGISDGQRGGFVYGPSNENKNEAGIDGLDALDEVLGDTSLTKVCFDTKSLRHALANQNLSPEAPLFDIAIAAYLLNPGQNIRGLEDVLLQVLDVYQPGLEELTGKGTKAIPLRELEPQKLAGLSRMRLAKMPLLEDRLREELKERAVERLYYEVELPLAEVLAAMERRGVAVDVKELRSISREFEERINDLTFDIHCLAGVEFNINSPKQLAEVLFERLGLPILKETKTGPSTNAEVLEQLAEEHQIAQLVLEYRQLVKLKSTYLDSLELLVHPQTHRIHTSFHQTATATGRLSSVNPNLQNIPVRTEEGRRIRRAFVAGRPDYVLLAADYSQIELRVLAHMSQDLAWIEAFRAGADIHARTAAEVFGIEMEQVTPTLRNAAKAINFGIVYGISSFGLAKGTGLSVQQAQAYIDKYFEKYSGVKAYLDQTIEATKEKGYITTLFNRRRYLPDIQSRRWAQRNFAERAAMNAPIQGTAADIIKMAMVVVEREVAACGLRAEMLLQVHDELVFGVHTEDMIPTARLVKETMEGIVTLDVPLVVEVKAGPNWRDVVPVCPQG
ncbi:MAG: DNA polymerase I [Firmicutes bacterium]|nr:DNA polymerase I [Bacillota bacterium]